MNSNTEEIKARVNIVDFIGGYVRLQKTGTTWKACCPFHNEKTPSFVVNEERQFWHCFGCGKSGDIFTFLMETEGVGFREALKILADRAGVELPQYNPNLEKEKNRGLEILELTTKFYHKQLWEGVGKSEVLDYLRQRGIVDKSIQEFRLGYAPDGWRNLLDFLLSRGYEMEEISKTGVIVNKQDNSQRFYDRFRDRIIFPIADAMGRVVGFTARVAPGGDESQAKYVNTPESEFYHKSRILYGIDKAKNAIKKLDQAVLVEGNMDVIASFQSGIENVIAVSGTALTQAQIDIIKRYTQNLYLFFDADVAGRQATIRSCEMAFANDMNVFIVVPKEGKDAADIVKKNPKDLIDLIKGAGLAMEYFLQELFLQYDLEKIDDKKKIINGAVMLISNFPKEIDKQHWGKKLAQRLDVDEKIIFNEISAVSNGKDQYRKEIQKEEVKNIFFQTQKRSGIIGERIISLFLRDENIWKKAEEKYGHKISEYFKDNNFISNVLSLGRENDFRFDRFELVLGSDEEREFLRKLKFSGNIDISGDSEQIWEEEWKYFEQLLVELGREIRKAKTDDLVKEIISAEKAGDKDRAKKITQELSEISQEID
jgi:DNA primase